MMTEADWNSCTNPRAMLECLRGSKPSARKLRLFAVACCKRVSQFLTDTRFRDAVEKAEAFAEGVVSLRALLEAFERAAHVESDPAYQTAPPYSTVTAIEHARTASIFAAAPPQSKSTMIEMVEGAAGHAAIAASVLGWDGNSRTWLEKMKARQALEDAEQSRILRDVFGSPFQHIIFDDAWLTPTVCTLAEAVYKERAFGRLSILADALEKAGCDNADILSHLQSPGPHTRGCWPLDRVLNKK